MAEKINFTIEPQKGKECACCGYWNKYPWKEEDYKACGGLPEGAPGATWGKCTLEGRPNYMLETYFSRGCGKHKKEQNQEPVFVQMRLIEGI